MEKRVRTWSTAALAAGLLVAGALSLRHLLTATDRPDGAGDDVVLSYLAALSLLGAGLMVLAGLGLRRRHPSLGTAVLVVGAVAGVAAGLQTVVVPLLVVLVLILTLRSQTRERA